MTWRAVSGRPWARDPNRKKKRRKPRKARKSAGGKGLPRWFIYVAYAACFAFCAFGAFFMMLYGRAAHHSTSRLNLCRSCR